MESNCQIQCTFVNRNVRSAGGWLWVVRKRVRSRKGEVGLPFSDTFWARWRCTVSGQRNVNHKDISSLSPPLPGTMGAVL